MKKFYEDSSQAKTLSKDRDIKYALRHFKNMQEVVYELREYFPDGTYRLVDSFHTRESARVAKEFAVLQCGPNFAIVVVDAMFYYRKAKVNLSSPYGMNVSLSEKELKYMNRDDSLVNLVKGVGGD